MAEKETVEQQMEKIFKRYNEFVVYDLTNIDKKLLELPLIVSYYQNVFYSMQAKLDEYDAQKAEMWQSKFLYYKHNFDFALSHQEIKQFIDRDLDIINIIRKMNVIRLIATRAEDTIKSLREYSWTIKHSIEWAKFQAGIVN